jgi:hypothetical protein
VQEVQEVQEALLSRPFCTFCTFCTFCIAVDALLLAWVVSRSRLAFTDPSKRTCVWSASKALLSRSFCTFCIAEKVRIDLPPTLWTPFCWRGGLAQPSSFYQPVQETLRLVGIETLVEGISADIL